MNNGGKSSRAPGTADVPQVHWPIRAAVCAVMAFLTVEIIRWAIGFQYADMTPAELVFLGLGIGAQAGVTVLFFVYAMDQSEPEKSTLLFDLLMVVTFCELLGDNIGWYILGKPELTWVNVLGNTMCFLGSPLMVFVFWLYQNSLYPEEAGWERWMTRAMIVLGLADIAYILLNLPFRYLFTIDEMGKYHPQNGYIFTTIYPVTVLVICIIRNLTCDIPARKRFSLLLFCLTPMITALSSVFFPGSTYTYVVIFLDLLLLYGTVQNERSIELARQREELARREQQIVLSQIQPHFLYNTLSAISCLCEEDAAQAKIGIDRFSRYMRMNLDSLQSEKLIPFDKELEHTRTYLDIECMRFEDRLHIRYDIAFSDFHLPPLTLQPLAENAVKHGICRKSGGGTVTIRTRKQDQSVIISVEDDGVGFEEEAMQPGIGIENVSARLSMLCGGKLTLESRPGQGATATIILEGKG